MCVLLHAPNCSAALSVLLSFISSVWLQKVIGSNTCTAHFLQCRQVSMHFFEVRHSEGFSYPGYKPAAQRVREPTVTTHVLFLFTVRKLETTTVD